VRGQSYLVGERKPEIFTPSTSGTIIPSVNQAMSRMQGSNIAAAPIVLRLAVEAGPMFVPTIEAVSGNVALQTTAAGVSYAQHETKQSARRQRQRLV